MGGSGSQHNRSKLWADSVVRFYYFIIVLFLSFPVASPDAILKLIDEAGLRIVTIAPRDKTNVYLHRDFLLVVEVKIEGH